MENILATFPEVIKTIGYIVLAILVLLFMITVHEFGHFIAGKILGFGIEEFSIGFGPKIFQKVKKNGEKFSVRIFPFGGFCSFTGEDKNSDDARAFNNKPPWKRIIVLISGVVMNYFASLFLIALMFGIYGKPSLMSYDAVDNYELTSQNKLHDRDIFVEVNGQKIYMLTDLMQAVKDKNVGDSVFATVLRDGKETNISIILYCDTNFDNVEDIDKLYTALGIEKNGMYSTYVKLGFFETIGRTFEYSIKLASSIFVVIGELFSGRIGLSSVGGTATTISVTAQAIEIGGLRYLLNIASFIGVNLALFNALPIPALDGSRVVFAIIEWIRKKPNNRKIESIVHTVGFILIVCFAIFVDVQQLF